MIPNNTVYFSSLLKKQQAKFFDNLERALTKNKINYQFINHTKDIWCRDYMPIQRPQNKKVLFRYNPSYLKGVPKLRTDNKFVCDKMGLDYVFSNIILDGGNVVQKDNKVILTDRIFSENNVKKGDVNLLSKLEKLLEAELIVIPTEVDDVVGHADGMVRFLDSNTVLVNDYTQTLSSKKFQKKLYKTLADSNLEICFSPYFPDEYWKPKNKFDIAPARGVYINYLQVDDTILLPQFENKKQNDIAFKKFSKYFKKIIKVDCNDLALQGGVLNCISWG